MILRVDQKNPSPQVHENFNGCRPLQFPSPPKFVGMLRTIWFMVATRRWMNITGAVCWISEGSGGNHVFTKSTQTKWGLVFRTGIIKWAPFWKGSDLMQIYGKFEGVPLNVSRRWFHIFFYFHPYMGT